MSAPARERKLAAFAGAAALALLCTVSSRAEAHRIGLSQGEYSLSGDRVESRLAFAASELAALGDAPGSKILDRTVVSRGSERCSGTLASVSRSAEDGVAVALRHDCERGTGDVHVDLEFLGDLEKGHRHIARVTRETGQSETVAYDGNTRLSLGTVNSSSARAPVLEYLKLGIEHILGGADHLLFLLGVVLLPASLRALLLSVTAFTLSHSLTLVLATLGIVRVNPAWVEPLIALSVAYVGVENWFAKDGERRWRLTLAFGLVHGLGFAGALRDVGIPQGRMALALASFNVGVEIGQLLVVLTLWVAMTKLVQRPWYRPWALAVASVALFVVGSIWSVERARSFLDPAPARATVGAPSADKSGVAKGDHPVSSGDTAVPPLVARLCQSLSELPRIRRAECSHTKPGISLGGQCTRMLATSVRSGAVSLVEAETDRCLADWNRRYEGCDFVEQASLPRLAACEHVLVGKLGADAGCHSSLECAEGLQCDGVGPMDSGRCRPLRDDGASCGLSVDPLMAYVQGVAGTDHRECNGTCVNNRCTHRDGQLAKRP